jgi:hypothetical protein
MIPVVYTLSDPTTGAIRYVGKTSQNLAQRIREHRRCAKRGQRQHVYCWWRSLGRSGHEPVVEAVEEGCIDIDEAERFWIAQLRALGFDLTNHTDGGEGLAGWRQSTEAKEKISRALQGNSYNRGKVRSESSRVNASRIKGGRPLQDHLGRRFESVCQAARELHLDENRIRAVLKGRSKQHKGHSFQYIEESCGR